MYYAEKYVDYAENTLDLRKFKQFITLIIVSFHCFLFCKLLSEIPSSPSSLSIYPYYKLKQQGDSVRRRMSKRRQRVQVS